MADWTSVLDALAQLGLLEKVASALGFLAASGLLVALFLRWLDRPKLRFKIREDGLLGHDRRLVFEASNGGRRPAVLRPTVRLRGVEPLTSWPGWHPDFLLRLLSKDQIQRWHLYIPLGRRGRVVKEYYDLEEEGSDLRLEAHAGARRFHAGPRGPGSDYFLLALRTYDFFEEGRRRAHRVHILEYGVTHAGRWRHRAARFWFAITHRLPSGPVGLDEVEADRKART